AGPAAGARRAARTALAGRATERVGAAAVQKKRRQDGAAHVRREGRFHGARPAGASDVPGDGSRLAVTSRPPGSTFPRNRDICARSRQGAPANAWRYLRRISESLSSGRAGATWPAWPVLLLDTHRELMHVFSVRSA